MRPLIVTFRQESISRTPDVFVITFSDLRLVRGLGGSDHVDESGDGDRRGGDSDKGDDGAGDCGGDRSGGVVGDGCDWLL